MRRHVMAQGPEAGSILILVLFVCLAVAVSVQALSTVVLCAQRAVADESSGRARVTERDEALAALRQEALTRWETLPWTVVKTEPKPVEGRVAELTGGEGWVMKATARHAPTASRLMTSGWLEKGRDGIDLPLAALVAGTVAAAPGRESPWLGIDAVAPPEGPGEQTDAPVTGVGSSIVGYLRVIPSEPGVGEGCSLVALDPEWRLDPGWRALAAADAVAPGPDVTVLTGTSGQTVILSPESGGLAPDSPCLVLATGGMTLDARGRGDVYGVLVVDDGDILLDGTTVHGAVFASETFDVGETGCVLFCRTILRWATDSSLCRVRLVPGTREEGME
jgi:hypothetical protein